MKQPPTATLHEPATPSKFIPSSKCGRTRVGLLRRTDELSSPISLSPFPIQRTLSDSSAKKQLDKGFPDLQSTLIDPSSKQQLDKCIPSPLFTPNVHLSTSSKSNISKITKDNSQRSNDMQLKAPESAILKTSIFRENETQTSVKHHTPEQSTHKSSNDIPFWLRPSPVQLYPYNFIMAVRKKLEAITNPVFVPKVKQCVPLTQEVASNSFKSPIGRPRTTFNSHFRQNLEKNPSESDKSFSDVEQQQSPETNKSDIGPNEVSPMRVSNLLIHSSEPEEYSMHFSPAYSSHKQNNEKAEGKQSAKDSQDTLSISSSILSLSSPEKRRNNKSSITNLSRSATKSDAKGADKSGIKSSSRTERQFEPSLGQMSPLNVEHVNGLHIQSRNVSKSVSSKEKTSSRESNTEVQPSSSRSMGQSNSNEGSEDVQKLLRDFNESLSMVIKVNRQLRHVLSTPSSQDYSKSAAVSSIHRQRSQSSTTKYSDDFEHPSDTIKQISIEESPFEEASSKHEITSYKSITMTQSGSNHDTSSNNKSHIIESIAELSNHINTQISVRSSFSNHEEATMTHNLEINTQQTKTSSTQIQEDLSQYSESPTNDLKSISLSIAKKSDATDTEQHSNVLDSIQKHIVGDGDALNQSIGNDIFAIFNATGMLDTTKDVSWSEHNISYANLGMVC